MIPTNPILSLAEGADKKTLVLWFEARKPVTDEEKEIKLVAELYKNAETDPATKDEIKLNPIEIRYMKPIVDASGIPAVGASNWDDPPICDPNGSQTGWCDLLPEKILAADGGFIARWTDDQTTCGDCSRDDVYTAGDGCDQSNQCRLKLTANRVAERYDWFRIRYDGVPFDDLECGVSRG